MTDSTTGGAEDFALLLTAAACSAGCLLAQTAARACNCRCAGAHHGAVLKTLTGQTTHPVPDGSTG